MTKKSFILYTDLCLIFEELTDEQAGQLIKEIVKYAIKKTNSNQMQPTGLSGLLNAVVAPFKNHIDRDFEAWQHRVEIAKNNGKKGGRPEAKKPTATKCNQMQPVTVTVTDTVTDTDTVNVISSNENPKKDDDLNFKKVWTKEYSQTAPHDDFNLVHKYITDRLPNLKRQSAHEINTWLEAVPADDILRHIDFCLAHSSSPPVSFKYFTPSIMSEATLKKELAEQTERLRAKYAE